VLAGVAVEADELETVLLKEDDATGELNIEVDEIPSRFRLRGCM
jgi:hypothetical protein